MCDKSKYVQWSLTVLFFISLKLYAQGPRIPYYYNPGTELSWGECYIYQPGGSKQKIRPSRRSGSPSPSAPALPQR